MFAYNELSKGNNTATISLDGTYEETIYVEPQQSKSECFEEFTL